MAGIEQQRAAIGVILRAGSLLMITRADTELAPGMVCFPGGGVKSGETIETALVREFQEELSVEVIPDRELWRSRSPRGTELHWWLAGLCEQQLIVPNPAEVAAFQWLEIEEIQRLENVLQSNHEFFEAWNDGRFAV